MSKLLLLVPSDRPLPQVETLQKIVDNDSGISVRAVDYPSVPPISAHDWTLADLAVLAAGQRAEEEGFDAVCLADFGDYGAGALRSLLSIPVIPAGRTAMLYALTVGSRFSVVASASDANRIKKLVREYGLDAQFGDILVDVETPYEISADVVICADPAQAPILEGLDLPVIDPVALSLKMAESLIGLSLSQSRRSYPEPQLRKPDLIRALMG